MKAIIIGIRSDYITTKRTSFSTHDILLLDYVEQASRPTACFTCGGEDKSPPHSPTFRGLDSIRFADESRRQVQTLLDPAAPNELIQ